MNDPFSTLMFATVADCPSVGWNTTFGPLALAAAVIVCVGSDPDTSTSSPGEATRYALSNVTQGDDAVHGLASEPVDDTRHVAADADAVINRVENSTQKRSLSFIDKSALPVNSGCLLFPPSSLPLPTELEVTAGGLAG